MADSIDEFDDEERITAEHVPYPSQSGEHKINLLWDVERRIQEIELEMRRINDPYHPICQVYTYLLGYRDALKGRIPNVPKR